MEDISHSLQKKSCHGNVIAGKTIYDGVFGGRPKLGVPTLSPRVEDYYEIFEGFHASRGSSIPILDLPEPSNLFFDVRSSIFDYSEVFGSFNASDFAASYDELFKQSKSDNDSSDEAWTPAQSESLSDESDPSGCSEKNQSLSTGDLHHSYDDTKLFNISYHKANPKGKEDILNGVTRVTQLDAIPGYSFIINETSRSQYVEESSHLQIERKTNFGGVVTEGKRLRKTVSQPPISDFSLQAYKTEPNPLVGNDKSSSPGKAFISVSDVSLRTRPSHLPPPSRPPPSFADKAENSGRLNSKLRISKSYVFERMEADDSPPYFDVEIDASSSAAASAAAMKDAVERAQAQLSNAKEMMERKKEGLQNRTKSQLEKDIGHKGEKIIEFDIFRSSKGDRVPHKYEREPSEMKAYAEEQRKKARNTIHADICTEYGKEQTQSHVSHKNEETVAWIEATQFYEVLEEKKATEATTLAHQSKSHDCGVNDTGIGAAVEQQEYHMRTEAAMVDLECQEIGEKFEVLKGNCEQFKRKVKNIAAQGSVRQEEHQEHSKLPQKTGEWQEKDKKTIVTSQPGETNNKPNEVDKFVYDDILAEDQLKENELKFKQTLNEGFEHVFRIKEAPERNGSGMERKASFDSKENEIEFKADIKQVKAEGKLKETLEQRAKEKLKKEAFEGQINENNHVKTCSMGQNKEKREEVAEHEGKPKRSKEVFEQENNNNGLKVDLKQQETKKEQNCACEAEKSEKGSKMTIEQRQNTERKKRTSEKVVSEEIPNDDIEPDENEKRLKDAWEKKEKWKRSREARESDGSEKRVELLFREDDTENRSSETNVWTNFKNNIKEERNGEGCNGQNSVHEQLKREVSNKKLNMNQGNSTIRKQQNTSGVNLSGEANTRATLVTGHDKVHGNRETQGPSVCEKNEISSVEHKTHEREFELKNEPLEERFNSSDMVQNGLQYKGIDDENKDESLCQTGITEKSNEDDIGLIGIHIKKSKGTSDLASDTENAHILIHTQKEDRKNIKGIQYAFNQEENKDKIMTSQAVVQQSVEDERKLGDVLPAQKSTSQNLEVEKTNFHKKIILEEREKEERLKRERDLENDVLRKIEEVKEREREREREKDLMAVDTATREACERAFAETRERAAMERATAEVRQRALAEARERLEKASAEARKRLFTDKASDARLRAERAAVERATAEARERAFEKAKADKASYEALDLERPVNDKFSAYSSNGGFRQSSSSNDLQNLKHQSMGASRDLKYSYSSVTGGLEGEPAQRCKARLERYQRTAERAAKALAEKNMRDLLAHKELTERNRLAESLDADVKRWSSGKEGNLRALLSTLQYILGGDSSWQPIPLTDVITAAAVKKAYRKATLCVHPDKLQQRGASIHQKYICEKVFDLLKEAWNKFNSEER